MDSENGTFRKRWRHSIGSSLPREKATWKINLSAKWRGILCYKNIQNIGVLSFVWHDSQVFIFDCNFKKQLHFVVGPNKRVSLALALRSTRFQFSWLRHLYTISLQIYEFLKKTDTQNDENDAMRMLCQRYLRFGIVLAFSCGQVKMIRKRYAWTQMFLQTERKNSSSNENGYVWTGLKINTNKNAKRNKYEPATPISARSNYSRGKFCCFAGTGRTAPSISFTFLLPPHFVLCSPEALITLWQRGELED